MVLATGATTVRLQYPFPLLHASTHTRIFFYKYKRHASTVTNATTNTRIMLQLPCCKITKTTTNRTKTSALIITTAIMCMWQAAFCHNFYYTPSHIQDMLQGGYTTCSCILAICCAIFCCVWCCYCAICYSRVFCLALLMRQVR